MPNFNGMVERANVALNRQNIGSLPKDLLAPGADFVEAAQTAGIALDPADAAVLSAIPDGVTEAFRGALQSAILRGVPVQIGWAPGYDYELSVWESKGTSTTIGAMTVFLRTRYPGDAAIPGTGS